MGESVYLREYNVSIPYGNAKAVLELFYKYNPNEIVLPALGEPVAEALQASFDTMGYDFSEGTASLDLVGTAWDGEMTFHDWSEIMPLTLPGSFIEFEQGSRRFMYDEKGEEHYPIYVLDSDIYHSAETLVEELMESGYTLPTARKLVAEIKDKVKDVVEEKMGKKLEDTPLEKDYAEAVVLLEGNCPRCGVLVEPTRFEDQGDGEVIQEYHCSDCQIDFHVTTQITKLVVENRLTEITVDDIDVKLLREQRDALLGLKRINKEQQKAVDGVINLLDAMLDSAEGYNE